MKYRKKPIEVEAVQWNGHNLKEIFVFTKSNKIANDFLENYLEIKTLEGIMKAEIGDWIIKGIKGEFYPCKDDIFKMSYESEDEREKVE